MIWLSFFLFYYGNIIVDRSVCVCQTGIFGWNKIGHLKHMDELKWEQSTFFGVLLNEHIRRIVAINVVQLKYDVCKVDDSFIFYYWNSAAP